MKTIDADQFIKLLEEFKKVSNSEGNDSPLVAAYKSAIDVSLTAVIEAAKRAAQ